MRPIVPAVALSAFLLTGVAEAAPVVFQLNFTGEQEFPGPGDPDGFAFGTLTIDTEPGVYGLLAWNFTYGNLDSIVGMHIHDAPAGASSGVYIGLGTATTGGPNTLVGMFDDNNWPGSYLKSDLQAILDNPEGFYVNIHTSEYQPGAVRAQLPEPASAAVIAGAGLMLLARRRR